MVDAFIAIDAGGEDKKSALQAKPLLLKLGTAMGDLILATSLIRKLKPEECSRQVVLDQAHKAFLFGPIRPFSGLIRPYEAL